MLARLNVLVQAKLRQKGLKVGPGVALSLLAQAVAAHSAPGSVGPAETVAAMGCSDADTTVGSENVEAARGSLRLEGVFAGKGTVAGMGGAQPEVARELVAEIHSSVIQGKPDFCRNLCGPAGTVVVAVAAVVAAVVVWTEVIGL